MSINGETRKDQPQPTTTPYYEITQLRGEQTTAILEWIKNLREGDEFGPINITNDLNITSKDNIDRTLKAAEAHRIIIRLKRGKYKKVKEPDPYDLSQQRILAPRVILPWELEDVYIPKGGLIIVVAVKGIGKTHFQTGLTKYYLKQGKVVHVYITEDIDSYMKTLEKFKIDQHTYPNFTFYPLLQANCTDYLLNRASYGKIVIYDWLNLVDKWHQVMFFQKLLLKDVGPEGLLILVIPGNPDPKGKSNLPIPFGRTQPLLWANLVLYIYSEKNKPDYRVLYVKNVRHTFSGKLKEGMIIKYAIDEKKGELYELETRYNTEEGY